MPHARRLSAALPAFLAVLVLAAFLLFPTVVRESASAAMARCASSLVPALYPYMAVSSLLVRRLNRSASASSLAASLVGLLAGFPVGASAAAALYREGRIGKRDAEVLAAVSSAASPAFLIGAVGRMWGDARFGWVLFLAAIPPLLVFFLLFRSPGRAPAARPVPPPPASLSRDLADAVGQAGAGCLAVTASVVFFSVLAAVGSRLFPPLSPLLSLTFEFSAGAAFGAAVGGAAGAAMTGAAVGFSGLAVLTQVSAPLSDAGLSSAPYLLSRFVLSAWLAAVSAVWASVHPMTPAAETMTPASAPSAALCAFPVLLFCLSLTRRADPAPPRGKNVPSSPCIFGKNLVK